MKKYALLCATAVVCASYAYSADLPVKVGPPVALYDWTGCYVGGHGGWGKSRKDVTANETQSHGPPVDVSDVTQMTLTGGLGGIQTGCDIMLRSIPGMGHNWLADHLVIGYKSSFSWANLSGNGDFLPSATGSSNGEFGTLSGRVDWIGSIVGRIGLAFSNVRGQTFMSYIQGGWATVHDKFDFDVFCQSNGKSGNCNGKGNGKNVETLEAFGNVFDQDRSGWTVGTGVTAPIKWTGIGPGWTWFLEYNHYDFGRKQESFSSKGPGNSHIVDGFWDVKQKVDTITAGLNYQFYSGRLWEGWY